MLKEAGAKRVIGKSSATIPLCYGGFFLHWFSTKKVFVVIVIQSLQGIVTHGVLSGSALQVGILLLLLLMLVVLASYKFNQSNCLP